MKTGIETERKFIIAMPSILELSRMEKYAADEIEQIYLPSVDGRTHRVRSRKTKDGVVYTETEKIRISAASSIEKEGEISEARFCELKATMLPGTSIIKKTRHTFSYGDQVFEIDIYPQWKSTAIMEAELPSEDTALEIPSVITVIREVTGNKAYSNAAMARSFPSED